MSQEEEEEEGDSKAYASSFLKNEKKDNLELQRVANALIADLKKHKRHCSLSSLSAQKTVWSFVKRQDEAQVMALALEKQAHIIKEAEDAPDAAFLVQTFLQLLETVRAQRCTAGLIRLVRTLPSVVATMPPLCFHGSELGVIDAVGEAVDELLRQSDSLKKSDTNAILVAALTLAIKRAEVPRLLKVAHQLLMLETAEESTLGANEDEGLSFIQEATKPFILDNIDNPQTKLIHNKEANIDNTNLQEIDREENDIIQNPLCDEHDEGDITPSPLAVYPTLHDDFEEKEEQKPKDSGLNVSAVLAEMTTPFKDHANTVAALRVMERLNNVLPSQDFQSQGWLATFGKADHGKLGHGRLVDTKALPTIVEPLQGVEIKALASLSTHALAVTSQGTLLVWGKADDNEQEDAEEPAFGDNTHGVWPRPVAPLQGTRISQVACGLGHILALAEEEGSVYSWGNGANGRLGLGDATNRSLPTLVLFPASCGNIRSIACGASHSLAIAEHGAGYAWGKNCEGQCGCSGRDDVRTPLLLDDDDLSSGPLLMLAGGWEHTLALRARDGAVFSFGSGYHDARRGAVPPVLGHGGTDRQLVPKQIEALADVRVSHIACGWDHSLAVTANGELYTWGSGTHGKLGHGDEQSRALPTRVLGELASKRIVLAGGGCEHTAAITADGELYTWGQSDGGRLGLRTTTPSQDASTGSISGPSELMPRHVKALVWKHLKATGLSVGDKYTMIIVRSRNEQSTGAIDSMKPMQKNSAADDGEEVDDDGRWLRSQQFLRVPNNTTPTNLSAIRSALIVLHELERHSIQFLPAAPARYAPELLAQDPVFRHQVACIPSNLQGGGERNTKSNNDDVDATHDNLSCFGGEDDNATPEASASPAPPPLPPVPLTMSQKAASFVPRTWAFAVDTSHATFQMIASLLDYYVNQVKDDWYDIKTRAKLEEELSRSCEANVEASLSTSTIKWIVLWSSLRILQVNVFWLAVRVALYRFFSDDSSPEETQQAPRRHSNDSTSEREARATVLVPQSTLRIIGRGLEETPEVQATIWNSLSPRKSTKVSLLDVLPNIHALILRIIEATGQDELTASLRKQAAEVLKLGFRLFYPSIAARVCLLKEMMAENRYNDRSLQYNILVHEITQHEHLASIISNTFVDTQEAQNLSPEELKIMLSKLVHKCTSGASRSSTLKLLISLQSTLLSCWSETRLIGNTNQRRSSIDDVVLAHAERVLSSSEDIFARSGVSILSLTVIQASLLREILFPLCASLCAAFSDLASKGSTTALSVATRLIPKLLPILSAIDPLSVRLSPEEASRVYWFSDLESMLSLAVSRLVATFIRPHFPEHSETSMLESLLNSSRICAFGPDNWPELETSSKENNHLVSIVQKCRTWSQQGLYTATHESNEEHSGPPMKEMPKESWLSSKRIRNLTRLGALQSKDTNEVDTLLYDLVEGSPATAAIALNDWISLSIAMPSTRLVQHVIRTPQGSQRTLQVETLAEDETVVATAVIKQGIDALRRALLAILLKSRGQRLINEAERLARAAASSAPDFDSIGVAVPPVILSLWQTAEKCVEAWVMGWNAAADDRASLEVFSKECAVVGQNAINNARFLLRAKQLPSFELVDMIPFKTNPDENLRKWSRANPRSDWRQLQRLISIINKWQARLTYARDVVTLDDADSDHSIEDSLGELLAFLVAPLAHENLIEAMRQRELRAHLKITGIDILTHLVSTLAAPTGRREVIAVLSQALGGASVHHFLDDLAGCGLDAAKQVQTSVANCFRELSRSLLESLCSDGSTEHRDLQLALVHAHAIKIHPTNPEVHCPPDTEYEQSLASTFLFDTWLDVVKVLGNLLAGAGNVLTQPSSQISRVCVHHNSTQWESLDAILGSSDLNDPREKSFAPALSLHRTTWLTVYFLALQLCDDKLCHPTASENEPISPTSPAVSSYSEADSPRGPHQTALSALFGMLLNEACRVRDRLEELLDLKGRLLRIHSAATSALVFGGMLGLGPGSRAVTVEVGELGTQKQSTISFWVRVPKHAPIGTRLICLRASLIDQPSNKNASDTWRRAVYPQISVKLAEDGWHVEYAMCAHSLESPRPDPESLLDSEDLPELRSDTTVPTQEWAHVCCTLSIDRNKGTPRGCAIVMELFLNSVSTAKRTRHTSRLLKVTCRELVIGDELLDLHDSNSITGCLADVSWHSTIMEEETIADLKKCGIQGIRLAHHAQTGAYCCQLVELLDRVAETREGTAQLTSMPWPSVLMRLLQACGATAQHTILKILRRLAGPSASGFISSFREATNQGSRDSLKLTRAVGTGASVAIALRRSTAHSIVEHLCFLLGHASCAVDRLKGRVALAFAEVEPIPVYSSSVGALSVIDAFSEAQGQESSSDTFSLGCGSSGCARMQLVNIDRHSLISDIVMLLRWLMSEAGWRGPALTYFSNALSDIPQLIKLQGLHEEGAFSAAAIDDKLGGSLAATLVLGGHIEGPRIGLRVIIPEGMTVRCGPHKYRFCRASRGTVTYFSDRYGKCFVVVDNGDMDNVLVVSNTFHDMKEQQLGLVLILADLVIEADISEGPAFASLSTSAISGLRYLMQFQPSLVIPGSESESKPVCNKDGESSLNKGQITPRSTPRSTPRLTPRLTPRNGDASGKGRLSQDFSQAGLVLLITHMRCHALRAIARQAVFPESAATISDEGLLQHILTLSCTDVATVPTMLFGIKANDALQLPSVESFLNHFSTALLDTTTTRVSPVLQGFGTKHSPQELIAELESVAQLAWERISTLPPSTRMTWQSTSIKNGHQKLEAVGGEISIDGFRACAIRHFPSVRLKSVALFGSDLSTGLGVDLVAGGRWYYEVVLLTDGLMQIGWADSGFTCDPVRGQGVGDHKHSWAIDGFRQKRWCLDSASYGERWQTGDVLGALLDLNLYEMRFFLNGRDLGVAFRGFRTNGLFPAASLNVGQAAHFNFGHTPFMHPPSGIDGLPFRSIAEAAVPPRDSRASRGSLGEIPAISTTPNALRRPSSGSQMNQSPSSDLMRGIQHDQLYSPAQLGNTASSREEDIVAEIEMRQQNLIENLIGMGFPVEWAIRAAESVDVTLNESVAIAWIIERMGEENAKIDDADNFDANLNYSDGTDEYDGDGGEGNTGNDAENFSADRYHIDDYYHHCANAAAAAAAGRTTASDEHEDKDAYGGKSTSSIAALDLLDSRRRSQEENDDILYDHVYFPSMKACPVEENNRHGCNLTYSEYKAGVRNVNDGIGNLVARASPEELTTVTLLTYNILAIMYARAACINMFMHTTNTALRGRISSNASIQGRHAESIVAALCNHTCHMSLIKVLKLVMFRSNTPASIIEKALFTPVQWKNFLDQASMHAFSATAFNPRGLVQVREAREVGLHPMACITACRTLLLTLALSNTSHDEKAGLSAIPSIFSLLIDEAASCIDSANRHDSNTEVDWLDLDCIARTDTDILGQPNLKWAVWILETVMTLGESLLHLRKFENIDGAIFHSIAEVFSAGLFGSLLDAARGISLPLRESAFRLLTRILRTVTAAVIGPETSPFATMLPSLPENYLSVTRERQLLFTFSSRLRKEVASRVLFTSYLQNLMSMLAQWYIVRKVIAGPNDAIDTSKSSIDDNSLDLALKVEEVTPTSVSLSWDSQSFSTGDRASFSLRSSLRGALGAEPFTDVATRLNSSGTFIVDGLNADTHYAFRLECVSQQELVNDEAFGEASGEASDAALSAKPGSAVAVSPRMVFGPQLSVVTLQDILLKFDSFATGPNLALSNDNSTVTNRYNKKWNACRATTAFTSGLNSWEVRIDRCVSKNVFIGVVHAEGTLENYVGSDKHGWGYLANKAIWHNKGKARAYGELYKEGDTIGVHLDLDAGNLWFTRNGKDLGIAVEGLEGPLYPAFSLYNKGDQLTLLPPDASGGSLTASSLHGTALADETISLALAATELLRDLLVSSSQIIASDTAKSDTPSQAIQQVCKYWRRWQCGQSITVLSAEGRYVTIDASDKACSEFQAKYGDRVRCPLGIATILGVANHHLWYFIDSQLDPDSPSGALMWSRRQLKDLRSMPADFALMFRNGEHCTDKTPIEDVSEVTISKWFSQWTIDMDTHLVHCFEAAAADSFALSYADADKVIERIDHPKMNAFSPMQIKARIALLLYLNELIVPLLPLLDLSTEEYARLDESSSCDTLELETAGLIQLVRLNKNRIFSATKQRLLRRAVLQWTKRSSSEKAENIDNILPEFSIGEESALKTIQTRPLIVPASRRRWWDEEKRLARTQFGQVCAQLALPMDFTKNSRFGDQDFAFRIKLFRRGPSTEHDDESTVYRNFFQTVCTEVSETNLLFSMTPNSARAPITNRGGDMFHAINTVFSTPFARLSRPAALDASRIAAYRAFGQLLGFALRTNVTIPNLKLARLLWSAMACCEQTREHLAQIDIRVLQVVEGLENLEGLGVDRRNFEALLSDLDVRFVVPSSDLNEAISLCPEGRCRRLEFESTGEFASLLVSSRMNETAPMIAAIFAGLSSVIPPRLLALFTETELEAQLVQGSSSPSSSML